MASSRVRGRRLPVITMFFSVKSIVQPILLRRHSQHLLYDVLPAYAVLLVAFVGSCNSFDSCSVEIFVEKNQAVLVVVSILKLVHLQVDLDLELGTPFLQLKELDRQ